MPLGVGTSPWGGRVRAVAVARLRRWRSRHRRRGRGARGVRLLVRSRLRVRNSRSRPVCARNITDDHGHCFRRGARCPHDRVGDLPDHLFLRVRVPSRQHRDLDQRHSVLPEVRAPRRKPTPSRADPMLVYGRARRIASRASAILFFVCSVTPTSGARSSSLSISPSSAMAYLIGPGLVSRKSALDMGRSAW